MMFNTALAGCRRMLRPAVDGLMITNGDLRNGNVAYDARFDLDSPRF
jgi:hypothetical protein